jgi:hypothetical protein
VTLLELQRRMAAGVMQPLARADRLAAGADASFIKPNDRLTSRERLEIYSHSYWYRLIDSLYDDFPGLLAIAGPRAFSRLVRAYLAECPSRSFTLRDLGSGLETWLRSHPAYAGERLALALDMIRLEWAHIEAFDGKAEKPLGPEDLLELGPELRIRLQPYIRLLELSYPVDDLRISLKQAAKPHETASNAVLKRGVLKRSQRGAVLRVGRMKPERIHLAVHRLDFTIYYRRLTIEEYGLLAALRAGKRIGKAVDAAVKTSTLPVAELQSKFEAWFAAWAELGWLCS